MKKFTDDFAIEDCTDIQRGARKDIDDELTHVLEMMFGRPESNAHLIVYKNSFQWIDEFDETGKRALFLCLIAYPDFFDIGGNDGKY